jgi:hypothetical protein
MPIWASTRSRLRDPTLTQSDPSASPGSSVRVSHHQTGSLEVGDWIEPDHGLDLVVIGNRIPDQHLGGCARGGDDSQEARRRGETPPAGIPADPGPTRFEPSVEVVSTSSRRGRECPRSTDLTGLGHGFEERYGLGQVEHVGTVEVIEPDALDPDLVVDGFVETRFEAECRSDRGSDRQR